MKISGKKLFISSTLFLSIGSMTSCALETSWENWDFDYSTYESSVIKDMSGSHRIIKFIGENNDSIYCGKIKLKLREDMSFFLSYKADSCDCFSGFTKLQGEWKWKWTENKERMISLYPAPAENSIFPWLMNIDLPVK